MRPRWQGRHALPVSGHVITSPRLREVHERLVRLGSAPLSDGDAAWQDLRSKLPERPLSWSGRVMAWLRRPAVAIMTTGLLSTGVAHAAGVQPVRGGVDWLFGGVTSIVGAKNEPRVEREARPHQAPSGFRAGAGSFEENRRRVSGGAGVESDREREPGGDGRGRAPAPAGGGSRGDEDREESRDDDQDEHEREDDDGDERGERREREERDDSDDEGRSEPDDDEAEEPDDEELEEPDDEPTAPGRGGDEDDREDLESDAYDEVELEEDRD